MFRTFLSGMQFRNLGPGFSIFFVPRLRCCDDKWFSVILWLRGTFTRFFLVRRIAACLYSDTPFSSQLINAFFLDLENSWLISSGRVDMEWSYQRHGNYHRPAPLEAGSIVASRIAEDVWNKHKAKCRRPTWLCRPQRHLVTVAHRASPWQDMICLQGVQLPSFFHSMVETFLFPRSSCSNESDALLCFAVFLRSMVENFCFIVRPVVT